MPSLRPLYILAIAMVALSQSTSAQLTDATNYNPSAYFTFGNGPTSQSLTASPLLAQPSYLANVTSTPATLPATDTRVVTSAGYNNPAQLTSASSAAESGSVSSSNAAPAALRAQDARGPLAALAGCLVVGMAAGALVVV